MEILAAGILNHDLLGACWVLSPCRPVNYSGYFVGVFWRVLLVCFFLVGCLFVCLFVRVFWVLLWVVFCWVFWGFLDFFNHEPIQGVDSDGLNLVHQIVATLVKCMIYRKKTDFHGLKIDLFHLSPWDASCGLLQPQKDTEI